MPEVASLPEDLAARARRLRHEHELHKTIARLQAEVCALRDDLRARDTTIYQLRDELLTIRPRLEERDTTIHHLRALLAARPAPSP